MDDEATGVDTSRLELDGGWRQLEGLTSDGSRYRRIVESAGMGIWVLDGEARTVVVNRALNRLLGYPKGALIGSSLFQHLRPHAVGAAREGVERRKRSGQTEVREIEVLRRDGSLIWLSATLTPMYDDDGGYAGVLAMVQDISERKHAAETSRRHERMGATATLAGGIAHTFNNLMLGIMGNAELLQQECVPGEDKPEMLEAIADSARRAGALANQLLAYSQGGRYRTERFDLNDLFSSMIDLEEDLLPPEISLRLRQSPDRCLVDGDRAQLGSVLLNLCRNSREAIEGGSQLGGWGAANVSGQAGIVVITTDLIRLEEPLLDVTGEPLLGDYATLSVEDSGPGMSRETREHAFEPFYTTRSLGRGLGLAAVHGIVKNHGGGIVLDSEQGRGTIVRIYLPSRR